MPTPGISGSTTSYTTDLSTSNNFILTITTGGSQSLSLNNPINQVIGQEGTITINTNGTNNLITFGTDWKHPGGISPVLSTTDTYDVISYFVTASNFIITSYSGDYS